MNRYSRPYEDSYPVKYQIDYITMMCLLEELWEE